MLRIGKLTDYATVILSYLAKHGEDLCSGVEVADATGIPATTVSKILKLLVRAELLNSVRGAKGGYVLVKRPDQISMTEIISAVEGPIALTECSISRQNCEQASGCEIRSNWGLINEKISHALASITLADLILPIPESNEIYVPVASLYR